MPFQFQTSQVKFKDSAQSGMQTKYLACNVTAIYQLSLQDTILKTYLPYISKGFFVL
jgi:hypothetical protein